MSVPTLGTNATELSDDELRSLASNAGITIPEDHLHDFARLLGAADQAIQEVLDEEEEWGPLKPDLSIYPRTDINENSDGLENGWAATCTAQSTRPKSDLLKGKTIALKDNIALAGVRCTNGTSALDWTPEMDATVATRIMDAGGIIAGKATCENMCMEGISDTSFTGTVRNPWAHGYSAGGSSSGCGALVAKGEVDMAVGCDQGGSIRIPACNCGIVGLKPTWGLVPYSGIISFEATIDHVGPMARTVREVARGLEVIAGPDGVDDRQPPFLPEGMLEFSSQLDAWLSSRDGQSVLKDLKIGVLKEGFEAPNMDPNIHKKCNEAIDKLRGLGAEIIDVSIPAHSRAAVVATCYLIRGSVSQGIFQDMTGRKQLYMLDRLEKAENPISQDTFDAFGPAAQNGYLRHLFVEQKYDGKKLHAKSANLLRKLTQDYDHALSQVDVLVMPTLPIPAPRLFEKPAEHGPYARLTRTVGQIFNTVPFNTSGHPALTVPVGFVPAKGDEGVVLPSGLQIVGKKFADIDCLKVGAAFEKAYDWKRL